MANLRAASLHCSYELLLIFRHLVRYSLLHRLEGGIREAYSNEWLQGCGVVSEGCEARCSFHGVRGAVRLRQVARKLQYGRMTFELDSVSRHNCWMRSRVILSDVKYRIEGQMRHKATSLSHPLNATILKMVRNRGRVVLLFASALSMIVSGTSRRTWHLNVLRTSSRRRLRCRMHIRARVFVPSPHIVRTLMDTCVPQCEHSFLRTVRDGRGHSYTHSDSPWAR